MTKRIVVLTREKMVDFAVWKWIECYKNSLQTQEFFSAALSGGKTPELFYRKLSSVDNPEIWSRTHIFQVDERYVQPDHPDSNYGMIQNTLLNKNVLPQGNVHPIIIRNTLADTARMYEDEIVKFFSLQKNERPAFDLILLGIGNDGHTASIFPNNRVINAKERLVSEVHLNDEMHHRITLTLPTLNNAKNIIFLVTGKTKASVLKMIFEEKNLQLPSSQINPVNGMVLYLLDSDAASELSDLTITKYQPII